ncbi:unnamed protein product [Parnassius apollo]|uniref:(apollo) hypothetical protein n=1 Tax=Parnassius apollo TaxID=110799 RepID=A0A8S3X063_PARAO|nr:unnamed protein product [Parnassius apollo]
MTASDPSEEKTVDLEDILSMFSISGRYHLEIAALAFLVFTTNSMYSSNYIFVAEKVNYRLGRKTILIVTGVLGGVFGIARSFSPWYWLYIAFEFFEAALGDSCSPAFILITEVISTNHRIKFILLCGLGYSFGGLTISLAAWLIPYWRTLLQMPYWFGLPSLIFGLASLFAGLVTFLVPDISNDVLSDTICEAEKLGKSKKMDLKKVNI